MKAWGLWLGAACAALSVLGAAPASQASAGDREIQPPSTRLSGYLGAQQGYDLAVSMPHPRIAVLYVFRDARERFVEEFASAAYAVRAHSPLSRGVLRAKLGSLGRVALDFVPSGKVKQRRLRRGCAGRPPVAESGTLRGRVSLEGEDGYFRVRGWVRVPGARERSFRLVCKPGKARDASKPVPLRRYAEPPLGFSFSSGGGSIALLLAGSRSGGRLTSLRASHAAGSPAGADLQVGTYEMRGGMAIGRYATAEGGAGTLVTSLPGVHPASATLKPPPPFHGEATFLENSTTSHSWTGSLGVELPGLDLPLAGPDFASSLCVVSPLKVPSGCDFLEPKLEYARPGAGLGWMP